MSGRNMGEGWRPQAREHGLLVEEVDDELLIFDTESAHAHALNSPAASIWRLADGQRGLAELEEISGLSEDAVRLAVQQLRDCSLLAEPPGPGVSRRAVLRSGVVGAGVGLATPVIRSLVAPTPSMAASPPGGITGSTGSTGLTGL